MDNYPRFASDYPDHLEPRPPTLASVRNEDVLALAILTCQECGLVKPALKNTWVLRAGVVRCVECDANR